MMGAATKIEWCDHTFNPWRGCTKIATGCANCYAEYGSKRNPGVLGIWGDHGTRVMASEKTWREPFKWDRAAAKAGERRRVFCASLADVFEDWQGPIVNSVGEKLFLSSDGRIAALHEFAGVGVTETTMADLRRRLFEVIDATPHLDWLLLSKRPQNIRRMWTIPANGRDPSAADYLRRDNVWLITSVAKQADADANIPAILTCRDLCPVLGVSAEPLIEAVDLECVPWPCGWSRDALSDGIDPLLYTRAHLDWVIIGGESGPRARPCDVAWIRAIRDQCRAAGVPVFIKQLGAQAYMSGSGGERFDWPCGWTVQGGETWIGLLDRKGGDPSEWPADLRVREWPQATE